MNDIDICDPVTMARIRTDIKQCCDCKRFLNGKGEYIDQPHDHQEVAYSHTYCRACADKMMQSLASS